MQSKEIDHNSCILTSVPKIQFFLESIQIQIQIQILNFESPRFRFNESEFVELIQKNTIQIQLHKYW